MASAAYIAARQAAAVAPLEGHGWLRVTGRDRIDFLQRLSTNDMRVLAPGRGQPTVLAHATGRLLALLIVYADEDALYLRTEASQAVSVTRYLDRMIFFQDQVEVANASAEVVQYGVFGMESAVALERMAQAIAQDDREHAAGDRPMTELLHELSPYGWLAAQIAGVPIRILRGGPLQVSQWIVIAPADRAAAVWRDLSAALPVLSGEELAVLRVEAGIPQWGYELNDQVTPLEAGLSSAVSLNKGCYTGQEVFARQVNYDKVTRQMVGLRLPGDVPESLEGSPLRLGRGRPGFVGTVVWSSELGGPIALAVVPVDAAEAGKSHTVDVEGAEVTVTVTGLPFQPD